MPLDVRAIDFVGYDSRGEVVLLAEAKARRGTSISWAAELRKNILSHGTLPESQFFLIVTPDRIYVWKGRAQGENERWPDAVLNAEEILAPYLHRIGRSAGELGGEAFEYVVLYWLAELSISRPDVVADERLRDSGFLDAMKNVRIEHQGA